MKIKSANRAVFDADRLTTGEYDIKWIRNEVFEGYKTWIELSERPGGDRLPTHEIRRYSDESEPGCEPGSRLLDWHEVWNGSLNLVGGQIFVVGFSRGPKAHDGDHHGFNYDLDEGTAWQRVEWRFVL